MIDYLSFQVAYLNLEETKQPRKKGKALACTSISGTAINYLRGFHTAENHLQIPGENLHWFMLFNIFINYLTKGDEDCCQHKVIPVKIQAN